MRHDEFTTTLLAAQAGSDRAVASLYGVHSPKILRYLRAQDPNEYADIAADTWLDAARNLRTFQGSEDDFAGWLFTIARRRLTDHRRAKRRRPVDPAPASTFRALASPAAEADAFAGRLGDEQARRIVEALPADQADVVLLRVVGGLDVETVAEMTGRRAGAVRVMQHRALKRLARDLDRSCNAEEAVSDGTNRDAQAPTPPR